jgi:molecular chaperone GrpE
MPNSRVSEQGEPSVQEREAEASRPEGDQGAEQQELRAELARLDDRYKRALADLDNYRKRSARELERRIEERSDELLREWLQSVDSVERALLMAEPGSALHVGLSAVLQQMEATLARFGVTPFGAAGEQFDPERHEAVGVVTSDEVPDRTIVEVARSGYAIGDRVLRPAQVVVARRGEQEA